ncbi:MAG: hypothetical protein KFF46_01425 [Desulfobacterales bacterium]|nr:hypothetical protein [Desulfobacterales bacterium]
MTKQDGGPETGAGFFAPDRFSYVVSCQGLKIEQTNIICGFSHCHRGKTLNVASKTIPCPRASVIGCSFAKKTHYIQDFAEHSAHEGGRGGFVGLHWSGFGRRNAKIVAIHQIQLRCNTENDTYIDNLPLTPVA